MSAFEYLPTAIMAVKMLIMIVCKSFVFVIYVIL